MLKPLLFSANPQAPALTAGERHYTYAQLNSKMKQLAFGLREQGVQPGDRVAVLLYNCPELIFTYYAAWALQATVVPLNHRLKPAEIKLQLSIVRPKIIITETSLWENVATLAAELKIERCYLIDAQEKIQQQAWSGLFAEEDDVKFTDSKYPAIIHFTSGTEGQPKAVMHHLRQLRLIAELGAGYLEYTPRDLILACLSLAHGFSFSMQLLPALLSGAHLLLFPRFEKEAVFQALTTQAITGVCLLPALCSELVELAATRPGFTHQLRYCMIAGDHAPMKLHRQFQHYFGLELCEDYGMTEAVLVSMNPLGAGKKLGSAGVPFAHVELKIVDEAGNNVAAEQIGEIAVRATTSMSGYWNDPRATAEKLHDGWFYTGDLGYLDADGYLWLKGRLKQVIVRAGSNILPQEVEAVLQRHPQVLEAGVTGALHPALGETVVAFVVVKSGQKIERAELSAFLRERLADYKMPEHIFFVEALPRRSVGKVDRLRLKQWARDELRFR